MNQLLPVRTLGGDAAADAEAQQAREKFEKAVRPEKFGIALNDESKQFRAAIEAGFLLGVILEPDAFPSRAAWLEEGARWFGTWRATVNLGQQARIKAAADKDDPQPALYDFDAWDHFRGGVPYASAVSQAKGNAKYWGVSDIPWLAAIDRQYGVASAPIVPPAADQDEPEAEAPSSPQPIYPTTPGPTGKPLNLGSVSSPSAPPDLTELKELIRRGTPTDTEYVNWSQLALLAIAKYLVAQAERPRPEPEPTP